MYGFGDEEAALKVIEKFSTVINGEVYLSIAIIEELNEGLALLILEDENTDTSRLGTWADGAIDVMEIYKKVTDGLLRVHAEALVPDTIPDDLIEE